MEFVNGIAQIVHMEVSLHGGAPNKNIGDAFLLVWKLPKGFTAEDIPKPAHDPRHSKTHKHDSASAGALGFGPIREPVNHLGFGPIREPMKQTTERRPSRVVNILAQADASTRPSLISTLPPGMHGTSPTRLTRHTQAIWGISASALGERQSMTDLET